MEQCGVASTAFLAGEHAKSTTGQHQKLRCVFSTFLKAATAATAAGTVSVAIGAQAEPEPKPADGPKQKARYRETDHVRRAYALARF